LRAVQHETDRVARSALLVMTLKQCAWSAPVDLIGTGPT
jgi:hypothetical protein